MQSPLVRELGERYADLKRRRSTWDDQYDEIQRFVRPNVPTFRGQDLTKGKRRHDEVYDGTAAWSLEQFAAGLSSYLTSSTDRWFTLGFEGIPNHELPFELVRYLEQVSDIIYHVYALSDSSHAPAMHETYLDIGGFGTAVLFQRQGKKVPIQFRSFPLSDCFVDENGDGLIDVNFRRLMMTTRQLIQAFPKSAGEEKVAKAKDHEMWEVVHACFPRTDREPKSLGPRGKKYASVYFCPTLDQPLEEGGSDEFLYHIPRWTKLSGEIYGRSPCMSVLPDVKMLNQMKKEIIFSAQLANRPPIVFDDDSMLYPVKGIVPGTILYKQPGAERPEPLMSGAQPQFAYELVAETREHIRRALYIDFLLRPKKNERQTTVEIMDDRSEMLRQMSPMLGRLQVELLNPMVERSYLILDRMGMLPQAPAVAQEFIGVPLEVAYISPAAKAQFGTKVAAMSQFTQDLAQLAQFDPSVMQILDSPAYVGELARLRDVSPKVIKDPKKLKAMQEAQAQQAQAQQAMEAAPAMSGAIKDIAQARQADPTLVQDLLGG
jgi:hypothetical protein